MSTSSRLRVLGPALAGPWLFAACYHGLDEAPGAAEATETADAGPTSDGPDEASTGVPADDGGDECVDGLRYFRDVAWEAVFEPTCAKCHDDAGPARNTRMVLLPAETPGYLEANYTTVARLAREDVDGLPLLVAKPTGAVEHAGGIVAPPTSDVLATLEEFALWARDSSTCEPGTDPGEFFADVELLDEEQTLRKAMFLLASRYPTPDEYDAVRGAGIDAVGPILRAAMEEPGFYERVREVFNDFLLTDSFTYATYAIDSADYNRFIDNCWSNDQEMFAANLAMAREPLNLVAWVLQHDRPFSEILTADYTIMNAYSARCYGAPLGEFADPTDENEFHAIAIPGIPQAGIIGSLTFLNAYSTTESNRNRRRARMIYQFFLGIDVMSLAESVIDGDDINQPVPTVDNPACSVCHKLIDPLAGALQDWTDKGHYYPPEQGWYADMHPPGFEDTPLPASEVGNSLPWAARQLVEDPNFATGSARIAYRFLMGREPLVEPRDVMAVDYAARARAYMSEIASINGFAERFSEDGEDFRSALVAVASSPWFRAIDAPELTVERADELRDVGTSRIGSPETVRRRLVALTGVDVFSEMTDTTQYLNYRTLYGGIDSRGVVVRAAETNSVMQGIADRMGMTVACRTVPPELAMAAAERLLLPMVELDSIDDARVRDNVRYLYMHMLGETRSEDDPEIERVVALFDDARSVAVAEGDELLSACATEAIPSDPEGVVRAWMAVLYYMLTDHRFLYD